MFPRLRSLLALGVLAVPILASAQDITWTPLDMLDGDNRAIRFHGVALDGSLVGTTLFKAYRVSPPPRTLTEILCPGVLPADPYTGPYALTGVNTALTVVGSHLIDVGGEAHIAGIVQGMDGVCTLVQAPDTVKPSVGTVVNTWLRGISDDNTKVGRVQGSDLALGLRRFFGVKIAPDDTWTVLENICGPDDGLIPNSVAGDWIVGDAQCRIQPNNRYTHSAFYCQAGVGCQTLTAPGMKPLSLRAVTSTGRAYGLEAPDAGVDGGKGWIVDLTMLATSPGTAFTDAPLPPATTPGGTVLSCAPYAASEEGFICTATELRNPCVVDTPGAANCVELSQWHGTWVQAPPFSFLPEPSVEEPTVEEPKEQTQKHKHERRKFHRGKERRR